MTLTLKKYVYHYLDVVAPGGDTSVDQNGDGYADGVLSTTWTPTDGNVYMFFQGTSMATPHVSAVAAMLYAKGYKTPESIRSRLKQTAYKVSGILTINWVEQVRWLRFNRCLQSSDLLKLR